MENILIGINMLLGLGIGLGMLGIIYMLNELNWDKYMEDKTEE